MPARSLLTIQPRHGSAQSDCWEIEDRPLSLSFSLSIHCIYKYQAISHTDCWLFRIFFLPLLLHFCFISFSLLFFSLFQFIPSLSLVLLVRNKSSSTPRLEVVRPQWLASYQTVFSDDSRSCFIIFSPFFLKGEKKKKSRVVSIGAKVARDWIGPVENSEAFKRHITNRAGSRLDDGRGYIFPATVCLSRGGCTQIAVRRERQKKPLYSFARQPPPLFSSSSSSLDARIISIHLSLFRRALHFRPKGKTPTTCRWIRRRRGTSSEKTWLLILYRSVLNCQLRPQLWKDAFSSGMRTGCLPL